MKLVFLNLTQGLAMRGLERVIDLYATELSNNHAVTVIQAGPIISGRRYHTIRTHDLDLAPQAAPNNLLEKLLFRLESDPTSIETIKFTNDAMPELIKLDPDLIIVGNGAPQLRILKQKLPNKKIVAFGQAGLGHHDIKTLLAVPDLFIALTNSQASWCKPYTNSKTKIIVIPNPVIMPKKSKKIDLKLPHPIVLTVGALSRYKNIVSTAKALKNLAISHLIIGDGEEGNKLQDVLSARPADFRWIKQVDPDMMQDYYHASDVFCFTPDPREAFGNVYIEAMASSLPIVATNDPVRREIIGNSGYYVDPGQPDEVRQAVLTALSVGRLDYREQLKKFDIKVVSKLLEKALYELIKE